MANTRFLARSAGSAVLAGHVQGLAQPCLRLLVHFDPAIPARSSVSAPQNDSLLVPMPTGLYARLSAPVAANRAVADISAEILSCLEPLNQLLVRLQASAGWPVCSGALIEQLGRNKNVQGGWSAIVVLPSFNPAGLAKVISFALAQVTDRPEIEKSTSPKAANTADAVLAWLSHLAPRGGNNRLLLAAAYQLGVPVLPLAGQALQFGWGARARWMESSFTDAASGISARLARDKVAAHNLMVRAGLPVPDQVRVATCEQALEQAERMGYPVVIKPADQDGGVGVESGLRGPSSLRAAYARSAEHSKHLVLERHIEGRDYRLGVLYGRLFWATHREPAGVWGDGRSSVADLIAAANCDPRRGTHSWSQMTPLTINQEAEALLDEQELGRADIPPSGYFVRLRRASNTSSGGVPFDVLAQVHPDNAALAERAASLFRLDIVGVDLICPDISRSWRETGGAICEVNGQPQFSLTAPETAVAAIKGLVDGQGRIPMIVILSEMGWGVWAEKLTESLNQEGINAGLALADGVFTGNGSRLSGRRSAFLDVQSLMLSTDIDAVVVATDGKEWLTKGMPMDLVDLVLADAETNKTVVTMMAQACRQGLWQISAPELAAPTGPAAWPERLAKNIVKFAVARSEKPQ